MKGVCLVREFGWFCNVFEFYGCELDVFVTGVTPMALSSSPFLNFLYTAKLNFSSMRKERTSQYVEIGKQCRLPKKELHLLSKLLTTLSLLESPPHIESHKLD